MPQSNGTKKAAAPKRSSLGKVGLLQRGEELAEFTAVLEELGIPVESFDGGLPRIEQLQDIKLILASTEQLLESGPPHLSSWPRTIAVIQDPSKTLSAHLGRIGVSMILCRPIHPQAIRLLLLHEVYRGPEKRVRGRTLIGQPVRLRSGLFSSKGTLLDLSSTGARIQMAGAPKVGTKIRLTLGSELSIGKPLKLNTKVVRIARAAGDAKEKISEVGLSILDAKQNKKAIETILQHFAFGPGRWSDLSKKPADTQSAVSGAADTESAASGTPVTPDGGSRAATKAAAEPTGEPEIKIRALPPSVKRERTPATSGISIQAPQEARTKAAEVESLEKVESAKPSISTEPVDPAPPEPELTIDDLEGDFQLDFEDEGDELGEEDIDLDVDLEMDSESDLEDELGLELETETDEKKEEGGGVDDVDEDEDESERRRNLRIPYDRRIVALGEEAARVLVGQDLSVGGMRVLSCDGVEVGDLLKVALHCGTMIKPVVVAARAVRQHGEEGMILHFEDLDPTEIEHLEKIISSSGPIRYTSDDSEDAANDEAEGPAVVGELLDKISAATVPDVDGETIDS